MKRILIYMMLLMGVILPSSAKDRAQQVIAHRGYWKTEGSAQNSISSLQNSYKIGVYGSEFDVRKQSLRAVLRTLIKIYTFAPNFKFGTK